MALNNQTKLKRAMLVDFIESDCQTNLSLQILLLSLVGSNIDKWYFANLGF